MIWSSFNEIECPCFFLPAGRSCPIWVWGIEASVIDSNRLLIQFPYFEPSLQLARKPPLFFHSFIEGSPPLILFGPHKRLSLWPVWLLRSPLFFVCCGPPQCSYDFKYADSCIQHIRPYPSAPPPSFPPPCPSNGIFPKLSFLRPSPFAHQVPLPRQQALYMA